MSTSQPEGSGSMGGGAGSTGGGSMGGGSMGGGGSTGGSTGESGAGTTSTGTGTRGMGGMPTMGGTDLARLPIPGNAEFVLWLFLEALLAVFWWFRDGYDFNDWVFATIVLSAAYFLSRGIAKASRVYEQ